jgi:hypothetical protein
MLITVLLLVGLGWDEMMQRCSHRISPPRLNTAVSRSPATVPPPASLPPASATAEPPPASTEASSSRAGDRVQSAPALPPTAPKAAAPAVWQLADDTGMIWTHSDPAWLRQWVNLRNEAVATVGARSNPNRGVPLAPAYRFAPSSNCSGGFCRAR